MLIQPSHIEQSGPGIDFSKLPDGLSIRMSDTVEDFEYARNAVTLAYDLTGYEHVRLTFEAKEYGDEPHPPPPNPFADDVNFDGLALSADGVNWYEIQELRSLRSDRFTAFDLDLDAAIAKWGLEYGADFRVRFCQYDNNPAPMDGFFLREIKLTALNAAVFHLTMDDNAASPTVHDATPGQRHQTFLDTGGNPNTDAHAVEGVVGGALVFDGVDDRIIVDLETGIGEVFAAGKDFTLAFWWKAPTVEFSEVYDYILTGPLSFAYRTVNNAIRFLYYRPIDNIAVQTSYDNSNDGEWHHYAVVREGTTVRLWRDGVSNFSNTHANNAGGFAANRMFLVAHSTDRYCAPGAMDDFRLYRRALGAGEIQELHDAGS